MEGQDRTKEIAREICADMNVEWDEAATAPTLRGKPLTAESVSDLFPEGRMPAHGED